MEAVVESFLPPRVEPLVGEEQDDMAHRGEGAEDTGVLRKMQEEDLCKSYLRGEVEQPPDKDVVGSHCTGVPCLEGEVA